jgi:hypothetical protein
MPTSQTVLRAMPRWAGLLVTTILLAQLMNMVVFGYFAHGQVDTSPPVQAEPAAAEQPPIDWLPVPTRLGVPRIAIPPDRAADNRAVAEDNP